MKKYSAFILFIALSFFSCNTEDDNYITFEDLYEDGEEYLTGELGVNSTSANAFGFEVDGLSFTEIGTFSTGNSLFNQNWVSAPASTTARDGLGPTFNARSCAGCHFKDGRGSPLVNGEDSSGFLMRVSLPGQDVFGNANPVAGYNTQIQDRANNGVDYEAKVNVTYEIINGAYPDGNTYELQKPLYSFSDEKFGSLEGILTSPRVAQQTIGLGFVNALPNDQILQFADEFDADGDGISGKANYVWNVEENTTTLGKYGWKANAPTLKQQIAGAFHGDMGLTSSLFTEQECPSPQQDCMEAINGGEPEVTDSQLEKVVFYQATLAVPNRRNYEDLSVLKGKVNFTEINCINCHRINQTTGISEIASVLNNITIKPYSDFLLHDMGAELADNRPDFLASGTEWRTQPLWGIGLISTVNNHTFFLHDGRARTIEEAILWHGGEAENSKNAFKELSQEKRQQVIDFVNSL